jgi:hypothetical protein
MNGLDIFVDGYSARKKITSVEFYERMIARTLHSLETSSTFRLFFFQEETINLNIKYPGRKQLGLYFKKYRETIERSSSGDQKNFLLALSYKDEGILKSLNKEPAENGDMDVNAYFDKAFSLYHNTSQGYLNASIQIVENAIDASLKPRKYLFIYPDMVTPFHPSEPRSYFYYFFDDAFLNYIEQHQLIDSFYSSHDELNFLATWISDYNTVSISRASFMVEKPRYAVLKNLEQTLAKRNVSNLIDLNWLFLYLGKEAQDSGRLDEMAGYYDRIDKANIFNLLREKNFFGFIRDQSFRMIGFAIEGYVKAGQFEKAHQLAMVFKNPVNRSSLYSFAATELLKEKFDAKKVQPLIDSAFVELERKENRTNEQPNRGFLAYAIVMQNPDENVSKAFSLIRNLPSKIDANKEICRSFAFHGQLYDAMMNIPDFNSGSDQADFLWYIMRGYNEAQPAENGVWKRFTDNINPKDNRNIIYVDEHS